MTADWLMQHGDPLGELMALQLNRGAVVTERESELLLANSAAWLQDLFAPEPVRAITFEAGVPVHIEVARPIQWRPACSTVRSVLVTSGRDSFLSPQWHRVRTLWPMADLTLKEMKAHPEVFERLGMVRIDESVLMLPDSTIELYDGTPDNGTWRLLQWAVRLRAPRGVEVFVPGGTPLPSWVEALRPGVHVVGSPDEAIRLSYLRKRAFDSPGGRVGG